MRQTATTIRLRQLDLGQRRVFTGYHKTSKPTNPRRTFPSHSPQGNGPPVSRPRCKSPALSRTQSAEPSTDAASRPLTLELAPYRRPRDRLPGPCSAHPVDGRGNHQLPHLCTRKRRSRFSPGILLFFWSNLVPNKGLQGVHEAPRKSSSFSNSSAPRARLDGAVYEAKDSSIPLPFLLWTPGLPASRQNTLFPTPVLRTRALVSSALDVQPLAVHQPFLLPGISPKLRAT